MPPLFALITALSAVTSVTAFRAQLQAALAADPALPFTLNPDDTGELLRPFARMAADLPGEQQAFMHVVNQQHARLVAVDRHERVNALAEQFARRDEMNPSLAWFAEELCRIYQLGGLAGLVVTGGTVQRRREWDAGSPYVPALTRGDLGVIRGGDVQVRPDGVLLPLGGKFRPRAAFWLDAPGREWLGTDRTLLSHLGHQLGLEVERQQALRYMQSLPALRRELLTAKLQDAYQPLLERALATIPGAECGSLLIREDGGFRFAASVTFDEMELQGVTFTMADMRDTWYGLGEEAWSRGVPRIMAKGLLSVKGTGYDLHGVRVEDTLPSVETLQANIGVPILYQGEVYGFLNVDSMTDPEAFEQESIVLAESFGQQAALLLHEAHLRAQVHAASRTDPLTGLPNRRAFMEVLTQEMARARRHGHPLSLLLADIRAFRAMNGTRGHRAGDEALVQVGAALQRELRKSDVVFRPAGQGGPLEVFRWGGDEFAILLPQTDLVGAQVVRERIRAAVRTADLDGPPIELSVGVATLSAGDATGEGLLREADHALSRDEQR
ncbi:GGDEF domain-containing protein [Deinococcus enclensis]|uniref:Diguanylate cyclase (GGDEF)-like protein n=1 Tax=Deinococcus enclensis TaxID=1049582 RepID=A0ABT9MIJ8_9DEIO|nr:sensor domain-containing diguanylate cyclase [Deinococcus enclensis]MDP9766411.1 diguanylate cyclase (GGDEF)-like protein [Deinococcus enclensis]